MSMTYCQTPYIYFHWTVSDNDSIDQYSSSFKCGYNFNGGKYYESCARIEKRDSSFFIGIDKDDSGYIYDLIINDSISESVMIIRIKEPIGFIVDINLGDIEFSNGYFEPELITETLEKGIKYFSLNTDWNNNPRNFEDRKLKTGQDKEIKKLTKPKRH